MRQAKLWVVTVCALLVGALVAAVFFSRTVAPPRSQVTATILQMNDVYEIMPLGGTDQGGLARVATVRRQLERENPNTFTILAGDLFSPSALGRAIVDGRRLSGRQMVDVMNMVGLKYATFGNHEFDLARSDFDERLKESRFRWVSSNVTDADGQPFPGVVTRTVIIASNPSGRQMRIGLFGLTLNANKQAYVRYADPIETAKKQVEALRNEADVIVAITHLSFDQDETLAEAVPELSLIVGGHEHQNVQARRGARLVPIVKADANAKSVYIHRLRYDASAKRVDIDSELKTIGADIAEDPAVAAAVRRWKEAAFAAFRAEGIEPDKTVATLSVELDGREASVRNQSTNLTQLVGQAMLDAFPGADAAIFNSGSIRIDDILPPGRMTQYDVLRVLPFSELLRVAKVRGSLLKQIVDVGHDEKHRNTGGYLQAAGVDRIATGRDYRVVMNEYLLNGKESGLEFIGQRGAALAVLPDRAVNFQAALIKRLETHGAP